MAKVWFEGVEDFDPIVAALGNTEKRVGAQGSALLRRTALAIEGTAKQLVPVDTGATRSSIGSDFTGDGRSGAMEATVGPTTDYAPFLERGTSRMPPRPFMAPAADRHTPEFLAAVEKLADPLQ